MSAVPSDARMVTCFNNYSADFDVASFQKNLCDKTAFFFLHELKKSEAVVMLFVVLL